MAEQHKKTRGDRRDRSPRVQDDYDQVIIDIARVTRVMAGGKRMRFRACVIIGNRKGEVGMGIAKGADVTLAVSKAATQARKHLIRVPIYNETIPHNVASKFKAAKVMLRSAPKGTGIIAGGTVRQIVDLAGISNIVAKSLGSKNKINSVSATLKALEMLKPVTKVQKTVDKTDKKPVEKEGK